MAYFTFDQLSALIPSSYLTEGLDDNADALEDAFSKVRDAAENRINAMLSARYALPLPTTNEGVAAFLADAGCLIAASLVYSRRGVPADQWPFKGEHSAVMARLRAIAKGEEPLAPALVTPAAESSAVVISAPAASHLDGLSA